MTAHPLPLAGRTIVVTRAQEQAGALGDLLREQGAAVVEVPLIRIAGPADGGAELRRVLDDLDGFDWLVVTSPNGAAAVAPALEGRRPGDSPLVAAIGPATAAALGERGADLVPARHIAEGLLEEFPDGPGRVLLVQGDRARDALQLGLAAREWVVQHVVGYRTLPRDIDGDLAITIARADAVTLLSGSAAAALAEACERHSITLPPHVVCIGPETRKILLKSGLNPTITARTHTLRGIVEALVGNLGTSTSGLD